MDVRLDRGRVVGLAVLIAFVGLTSLPWYRFAYGSHVTAWTTNGMWKATAVLGTLAGVALLTRGALAAIVTVIAAVAAIACWSVGSWQQHHPRPVTVHTIAIANFTAGPHISPPGRVGQTISSYLALGLLVLILILVIIRLFVRKPSAADPAEG